MAMSRADQLTQAGFAYPVAIEIDRQMTANAGDFKKLMAVGIPPLQASELASHITAQSFNEQKLTLAGWNSAVAKVLKQQSGH